MSLDPADDVARAGERVRDYIGDEGNVTRDDVNSVGDNAANRDERFHDWDLAHQARIADNAARQREWHSSETRGEVRDATIAGLRAKDAAHKEGCYTREKIAEQALLIKDVSALVMLADKGREISELKTALEIREGTRQTSAQLAEMAKEQAKSVCEMRELVARGFSAAELDRQGRFYDTLLRLPWRVWP